MLKQYKTVSIIYGGSGAKYASQLRDLITAQSEENRYPITVKVVLESVLTGDLLHNITELFTQTEYCIAILTADDCCLNNGKTVYRIRQNVLFELGMALYRLGRDHCIFLSDFDPADKEIELPSDLKSIDIKSFTEENHSEVFNDVLNKILSLNSKNNENTISQYDALLDRTDFFVNYEDLLASSSHLDAREGSAYLKGVLKHWENECKSFTHYEEKCLYFLERIGLLPMFGRHAWVHDWLIEIEKQLNNYTQADINYCGRKRINFIRNLALTVGQITRMKLVDGYTQDYATYDELVNTLILDTPEDCGVSNPLIATVYYDYLGLLHMYLDNLSPAPSHIKSAIECFEKIMDTYVEHTDMSLGIWSGFVGYNLARCYLMQYKITKNPEDATRAQNYFLRASIVRKRWLSGAGFHSTIRSALSYEYFICKIEQISTLKLLNTRSEEEILQEFKRLEGELESYMIRDEQLERLCFVQELLEQRQSSVKEEAALSESLL